MIRAPFISLLDLMKHLDAVLLLQLSQDAGVVWAAGRFGVIPDDTVLGARKGDELKAQLERLTRLEAHCIELGLVATAATARKLMDAERNGHETIARMRFLWSEMHDRLVDELRGSVLMALEPDKARLFNTPHPFGDPVAQRFPSAVVDVEEAAKCLALDRATACVFHLMRVLEIGLQALASDLGLTKVEKNWQQLIQDVDGKINALPHSTAAEKEHLAHRSGAVSHLKNVKDAWRNDVMHPRAAYSEEQAHDIWTHTRALMRKLADFL